MGTRKPVRKPAQSRKERRKAWPGAGAAEDVGVILGLRLGRRDKGFAGGLKVLRDGKRGLAEGELLGFRPKQVVE